MLKLYKEKDLGRANHGWLNSWFHFSFSHYYNKDRMNFGSIRVINDDIISPKTGFDTHPHRDMEIVSYIIDGTLSHSDSMNNTKEVKKGEIQYLSAGTGITHSEYNNSDNEVRLLQIWIYPDEKNQTPQYGDYKFNWEDRINKFLHLVSSDKNKAPINLRQNADIYALYLEEGNSIEFINNDNKQYYLVLINGKADINYLEVNTRDGLEGNENLSIKAINDTHLLIIQVDS